MDPALKAIVSAAGAGEELRKYIEDLGISSVGVFAELGETIQEFDEAVVEPLRKPYKLSDGNIIEVLSTDFPVTRARLRHVWKKCRDASSATPSAAPAATTTGSTASASSSKKELPAGYWQAQVKKFESVTIKGIARRFPETLLLGAEATLARVVSDAKSLQHNAIPLEEIVQTRHFKASGEPNNLSTAKKRSRSNEVTTLVLNADLQLEAEPEDRWRPQSQTALLDCLQAIHMALIFVEYAPEHELDKYFEWWQRLVRSRPNKIEQLKIHWENTSWRIALALRKSTPFHDVASEIMIDSQSLQETMSREVAVERPTKIDEKDAEEKANNKAGNGSPTAPAKATGKGGDAVVAADSSSGDSNAINDRTRMIEISGVDGMMIAVVAPTNVNGGRGTATTPHAASIATRNRDSTGHPLGAKLLSHQQVTKRDQKIAAIDFVVLSFFDGLGTAFLVCDNHCKEKGLSWRGASWEIDEDLVKLGVKHFPDVVTRGDFEEETADSLSKLVQQLDPSRSAQVIIAAGPPCHDFSRVRQDAPGHEGTEGSKFTRFAQLIVNLEKSWNRSRATLLVENVIPQNRADMRKIEKLLDAPAVVHDSADFGTISRPRVWWCRIPWSEVAHRKDCPFSLRWTSVQGIPRVHFDVPKDDTQTWDTQGLTLPRCLTEEMKPLPCLTTPSDDPSGRPAPRSAKGKISSDATQRWMADKKKYAPWHYESGVMMTDGQGRCVIPPASVKEQFHHLPVGWTRDLHDHARHKALANGWHAGAARLIFTMAVFAATVPTPSAELNPLGDYDDFDLSYLDDPTEHWERSRIMPHPDFRDAALEPGLEQWLEIWRRMRPHLPDLRHAVVEQVEEMVVDMSETTAQWFSSLKPHVQKAYFSQQRTCSLQLPVLRIICERFGWQDPDIFEELTRGFRLLGPITPGLGWRKRNDLRYANPLQFDDFIDKNERYVCDKLRRVDPCWEQLANEIAEDVRLGRMEGPFTSPTTWPKTAVPLATHTHTRADFYQVGSDNKPKVRRAEDWRRSFANATVGVSDTPPYHDVSAYVRLAVAIKKVDPSAKLLIWGLDHESAYRQLAAEDPDHTWVVLPTPHGITLWRHTVLMFGSVASVWSYCRVADLMSWLCRACLLTPALHFVDDFGSCEDDKLAHSSFEYSKRLCRAIGFSFKQSKEQPPDRSQVIQGVDISVHADYVMVQGTSSRRQRLDADLVAVLTADRLPPHEASSLAGKLQFFCQALMGRSHAAALKPLFARAKQTGHGRDHAEWRLNDQLRHGIGLIRWSLHHASPRQLMFRAQPRSVIYADAFFNLFEKDWKPSDEDIPQWGRTPPETLRNGWGFVATARGQTFYAAGRVPHWFVREFARRRAYIYMLEIVAQILPLLVLYDRIDQHVIMFVDNEPARHALSKGFGKDDSINRLLQHSWRYIEEIRLRPAWQRVTSSANVSNAVSRGDLRHARAEGWTLVEADWD
ncbi:Dnmt3a, partial [Symbiodinium sp. CCMP2456]